MVDQLHSFSFRYPNITQLMIDYKLNEATPEQRIRFERLLKNEALQGAWTEFNKAVEEEELDKEITLEEAITHLSNHALKRRRERIVTITEYCLSICFFVGAIYCMITKLPADSPILPSTAISLKIDDAEPLILNPESGSLTVPNKGWKTTDSQLTVTSKPGGAIKWSTLSVGKGKDFSVLLPDGSLVHLNSTSTLRFPSAFKDKREVFLTGEGFFDIKQDEHRPFIVHAATDVVTVLGTSFNVNSYIREMCKISLITGRIKIKHGQNDYYLRPGEELVGNRGSDASVRLFDVDNTISWRTGVYKFNQVPLRHLIPLINSWFEESVIIGDLEVLNIIISGCIDKNKPLSIFMNNLHQTSGIICVRKNQNWYISKQDL